MSTWDDYQVAKEIHKDRLTAAEHRRLFRSRERSQGLFLGLMRRAAHDLGGWLVTIGTWLQSGSTDLRGGWRSTSARAEVLSVEQNC